MREKNLIEPALYIVPTPIGNLDDISLRAINVLKEVDIVACEDTRRAGQLMKYLEIKGKKFISYHEHNEREKSIQLAEHINQNKSIALISDAGTPGISDPAYRLINECIKQDLKIIPLPGATAFVPALLASGFGTDKFMFLGFPPHKKGRKTFINDLTKIKMTAIIYESPYRIEKLIKEMNDAGMSERHICIAREITKLHEEYIRGTVDECLILLKNHNKLKGEFVIVVAANKN